MFKSLQIRYHCEWEWKITMDKFQVKQWEKEKEKMKTELMCYTCRGVIRLWMRNYMLEVFKVYEGMQSGIMFPYNIICNNAHAILNQTKFTQSGFSRISVWKYSSQGFFQSSVNVIYTYNNNMLNHFSFLIVIKYT